MFQRAVASRPVASKPEMAQSPASSGRTSPLNVPANAPPSTHATSSVRKHIRAQIKARRFPSIQYAPRVSHLDPKSTHADFRGFYVLFWIALAIMVITSMLRHWKETGYPFRLSQMELFKENIVELGPVDLLMTASSGLALPLHRMFMTPSGFFRWSNGGRAVQTVFEAAWLGFWIYWPYMRNWTWTAQVFFTLHFLTIFMKMHSYAFYNGHLAETRLQLLDLDSAMGSSSDADEQQPSLKASSSSSSSQDQPSPTPAEELSQLRETLAYELTSPLGHVTYPDNLSASNYADFICCPTLCYQLEYPRTARTDWLDVLSKTLAVFGCIFLLIVTSEDFIIPVLSDSSLELQRINDAIDLTALADGFSSRPTSLKFMAESALVLAETISRLLFPFMVALLLVFLVIFEYVLGVFAELTRFADRQFYSAWWNSTDWLEFSRTWNKPVHHFLNRHVYSVSLLSMPKAGALTLTFLVSALAHELIMACITKKLRGYGLVAMMMQIPIVFVQRSKWVRGRTLLNNFLFWASMISGLALICSLYVLF